MAAGAPLKDLPAGLEVLTSEADLAAYSYDAAAQRARPQAVVLARGVDDVRRVVAWCRLRRRFALDLLQFEFANLLRPVVAQD